MSNAENQLCENSI